MRFLYRNKMAVTLIQIQQKVMCVCRNITVEPFLFLFAISSFLSLPIIQALLYQKSCLQQFNSTICDTLDSNNSKVYVDQVQTKAAHWFIYLSTASLVPSIFVSMLVGSWNDKIGRRYPMMMPVLGQFLNMIVLIICSLPQYLETSMAWILIGSFLSGLTGGFISCITCVFSYISIVSTPSNRVIRIAILESMMFISSSISLGLSGVFLKETSFTAVFSFIIGVIILMELYIIFFIKEPVPVKFDRNNKSWCSVLFNMDNITGSIRCVLKKRPDNIRRNIWVMMAAFAFILLTLVGPNEITYLFLRHDPVHWHKDVAQTYYGYYAALSHVMGAISMLTILPVLRKCFHLRDKTIALIGILSRTISLVLLGFSTTTWMVFCVPVVGMLYGFSGACLRGLISKMVEQSEQGRVFSIVSVVEGVGVVISSVLFNGLYPETLSFFPGFSFLFAATLAVVPGLLILTMNLPENNTYGALEDEVEHSKQHEDAVDGIKFDDIL